MMTSKGLQRTALKQELTHFDYIGTHKDHHFFSLPISPKSF